MCDLLDRFGGTAHDRGMRARSPRTFAAGLSGAILIALSCTAGLRADTYPVFGKWTYDNPLGKGPARDCGRRVMEFRGERRFDTGGGVPSYRNVSVQANGDSEYEVVDAFATGQINARATYTLRVIDSDHIEIRISGNTLRLRRCA
jgi:hypothetical protein